MVSRGGEAAAVGVAGALVAFAVARPVGLGGPGAVVGLASGLVNGWRRTYDWHRWKGRAAFVADHTWALPSTAGGLVSHTLSAFGGSPGYVAHLSERRGRHVYERGFSVRRGFAMTMGNVVTGAAGRHRLVEDHEQVHIVQARLLGPLYPLGYVTWSVLAAPFGVWRWWRQGRVPSLGHCVDAVAYRANPFERWAYAHQARRADPARATGGTSAVPR